MQLCYITYRKVSKKNFTFIQDNYPKYTKKSRKSRKQMKQIWLRYSINYNKTCSSDTVYFPKIFHTFFIWQLQELRKRVGRETQENKYTAVVEKRCVRYRSIVLIESSTIEAYLARRSLCEQEDRQRKAHKRARALSLFQQIYPILFIPADPLSTDMRVYLSFVLHSETFPFFCNFPSFSSSSLQYRETVLFWIIVIESRCVSSIVFLSVPLFSKCSLA